MKMVEAKDYNDGAAWMLEQIRASLRARLEGFHHGGDRVIMNLVDQIVRYEQVGLIR